MIAEDAERFHSRNESGLCYRAGTYRPWTYQKIVLHSIFYPFRHFFIVYQYIFIIIAASTCFNNEKNIHLCHCIPFTTEFIYSTTGEHLHWEERRLLLRPAEGKQKALDLYAKPYFPGSGHIKALSGIVSAGW